MALIKYIDCINYEGNKVLLFTNIKKNKLASRERIDPHFDDSLYSPFARFKPTKEGIKAAILLAENIL